MIGVVLAGGASRRMGERDKVLEDVGGETLLARAVRRLGEQVDHVMVSGPAELADHCDATVVPDGIAGRAGPLAGVLAALDAIDAPALVTAAVDTPFFPFDLVERLAGDGIAIARSDRRLHPVFACWPAAVREPLRRFLEAGDRKIMLFAEAHGYRAVDFDNDFFNVNTPDELAEARSRIGRS